MIGPGRQRIYLILFQIAKGIRLISVRHRSHYSDAIMSTIAYQITSLTIVCLTVYSGADQRKHQSSASLAFVTGEFPTQRASNAETVSIWWHHHAIRKFQMSRSQYKWRLSRHRILIVKMIRSSDRLIFIMGISSLVRWQHCIETVRDMGIQIYRMNSRDLLQ